MVSLMIAQSNSLNHNILEESPTEQKPLSGILFTTTEQLKDDNRNILQVDVGQHNYAGGHYNKHPAQ